ncbi:hypothetical protein FB451DRAFT_1352935 [Mycena latifolia]|nr:hypothetical protein FB451DRAFT_1352935 [Mycena latifolia]
MSSLEPKADHLETQAGVPAPTPPRSLWTFLPEWVSGPLQSPRSWKVLLRCWIAVFASFVLLLPNASLRTVGTTSFFALITSLFLPPYFPIQLTVFLLATLMIGLLAGWGIGLGAMRAANAVRDPAHIQAAIAQVQASIQANPVFQANPALAQTTAIFAGLFLDVRATAVYGVFLAIGAFIFGLIRAYAPKLLFMSIFGTIAIDIFCAVGPLFPSKRYTLLNSTAISIGCYMGIALLTTIFVFPETMSHATMDAVAAQLARVQKLIEMQDGVLAAQPADRPPLIATFRALRALVITTQQQLSATSGFLALEFSWGRWNGDDVRSLEEPTVALITRVACLLNFSGLGGAAHAAATTTDAASDAASRADMQRQETYLLRQLHTRNAEREAAHGVRPADVLPLLDSATRELRHAAAATLAAVRAELAQVNHTRWRRDPASETTCSAALDAAAVRLRAAVTDFNALGRTELLAPFLPLLDAPDSAPEELPLRALFVAYVFAANMVAVAEALLGLAGTVQAVGAKRKRARLWAPTHVRGLWKLIRARGDKADGAFGEDTSVPVAHAEEENYRRDPDSRPPTNALQRLMHFVHALYQWTGTAEAIFTFKYVFISIALWLPAVFRSTAHFYYVEKGIWALIMAQTTINIYAADQIYNYVTRLGGTFLGLGFGLVAWYAGNGTSNGNPYGAAAAFGVVVFPLVFLRVFAPERFLAGNVMCCATFALVVGYSWIDGHAVQFASPGIGWTVAWKRWALVVTGSAASFIVMMFPPKSGRKAVRQRNAASIASLASAYGVLVAAWIARADADADEKLTPTRAWTAAFRGRLMALAEEMHAIRELTGLAKWEGSVRGRWPAKEYERLVDVQVDMVSSLAQLGSALGHLEKEWRRTFLHSSKVLNPNFIADVMAVFALVSQSLHTGEPMHQVLPSSLLDRLFYHHGHTESRADVDVAGVKSLGYMYYASAIGAVYQLLHSLDELHALTKDLCGEIPLVGWVGWREEYERSQAVV